MKLLEVAGRGQQVMQFNDYMDRLAEHKDPKIAANSARYKKLGSALFKKGFTYDDTSFHMLPKEGGVWEFDIPGYRSEYELSQGYVDCHHYFGDDRGRMMRFKKTLSLMEIELWTVDTLMAFMHKAARPDR